MLSVPSDHLTRTTWGHGNTASAAPVPRSDSGETSLAYTIRHAMVPEPDMLIHRSGRHHVSRSGSRGRRKGAAGSPQLTRMRARQACGFLLVPVQRPAITEWMVM